MVALAAIILCKGLTPYEPKIIGSDKYIHYVSIQYLFRKIIAILPGWLEITLNIVKVAMPQKIMMPISFGDIKLYICEKQ